MSIGSRRRRGYSLIEALVAVAITGVGVTAALGGMRSLARNESRLIRTELMQRLAFQKYDEILATGEVASAPLDGDFRDRGVEGYEWRVETEQSGIENLSTVIVIVSAAGEPEGTEVTARGMHYQAPVPVEEGGGQ